MLFECYDNYGCLKGVVKAENPNLEEVVVEHQGMFYKPMFYELNKDTIAKCCPIKVLKAQTEGEGYGTLQEVKR